MNLFQRVAFACLSCLALAALSSCSATGRDRSADLPPAAEVFPQTESLTAFGADPSWIYDTDAYPAMLEEALKGRHLPHVQIYYTTDESIVRGGYFGASLFEAESRYEALEFWAAHGPETVHTQTIMLDDVAEGDRDKALRFARHTMTAPRPDESWSIVCLGGTQAEGDNSDCDELFVWVTWCNKVLELDIGLSALEYRSAGTDSAVRDMVDSIRSEAGC